jgi:hypothetical protein
LASPPILDHKYPDAPSVFEPAALLREARREYEQACPGIVRQVRIGIFGYDRQQLLEPFASLRGYNAKLGHVGSHRIDQLRTLTHQKIAGAMLHQLRLLFSRLHLYETHGRPPRRLADRFRVSRIITVLRCKIFDGLERHARAHLPTIRYSRADLINPISTCCHVDDPG